MVACSNSLLTKHNPKSLSLWVKLLNFTFFVLAKIFVELIVKLIVLKTGSYLS